MTDINRLQQDLSFIRLALRRRSCVPFRVANIYLVWAVYALIGYFLLDVAVHYGMWFLLIGGALASLLSWRIGQRAYATLGIKDLDLARRAQLHFSGGVALALLAALGLALVIPELRNFHSGQIVVVLIGMVYFLGGVHLDGHLLWLGPLLILGGVLVGFIPAYPWTCLGVVIALGLCVPWLAASRHREQQS